MKIEIDQSGKVEYTTHDTVIAFSNGKRKAIRLTAKDKRILQDIFRKSGKIKIFVIRVFTILIYFLLRNEKKLQEAVVDIEYPGWDAQIKNYLLTDLLRNNPKRKPIRIDFKLVGKTSEAHWHAYYVFKKKRKAEMKVTAKDILEELLRI